MKLGLPAAALGALLFSASSAVYAAPAINITGATDASSNLVQHVREGGRGGGSGMRAGGGSSGKVSVFPRGGAVGAPKASGKSSVFPSPGPKATARGGPNPGAYKGDRSGRYAGKAPRGGDWGRSGKRGGYAWKGGKGDKHHHHRYRYPYFYPGAGLGLGLAYGGAYAYGDECGWLYRRAQATGSPYWWSRFEECRYSYY